MPQTLIMMQPLQSCCTSHGWKYIRLLSPCCIQRYNTAITHPRWATLYTNCTGGRSGPNFSVLSSCDLIPYPSLPMVLGKGFYKGKSKAKGKCNFGESKNAGMLKKMWAVRLVKPGWELEFFWNNSRIRTWELRWCTVWWRADQEGLITEADECRRWIDGRVQKQSKNQKKKDHHCCCGTDLLINFLYSALQTRRGCKLYKTIRRDLLNKVAQLTYIPKSLLPL